MPKTRKPLVYHLANKKVEIQLEKLNKVVAEKYNEYGYWN